MKILKSSRELKMIDLKFEDQKTKKSLTKDNL
jgi:hypothetical protein